MTKRKTVGLALGGGAARGIAHIGVLKALTQAHIPIDFLAGTSSGSLIAACYAAGMPVEYMIERALQTHWRLLTRLSLQKTGLSSGEKLSAFLHSLLDHKHFADLQIPLAVVTTDLYSGEAYLIQSGEVEVAVRASCSVPGIFPPVSLHGKLLVDGGLVNNVPVDVVRQMGADIVIGVDVNEYSDSSQNLDNLFTIVLRSLNILMQQHVRRVLQEADVVLLPPAARFSPLDLNHVAEMVALGEEAARAAIPQIQQLLASDQP
ncbi:MAG: patatin family protein [Nitrospinota bacterium]|nr:MAG: patatin family protein [Nitrospinota bacterium]